MDLILNLKKKWFAMWKSGEKTEDYREMNGYWTRRLCCGTMLWHCTKKYRRCEYPCEHFKPKNFKRLILKECYPRNSETNKILVIDAPPIICIGEGKTEWGAEKGKRYFVIKKKTII